MSEDRTRELPKESSFEVRVLSEFAAIRGEQVEIRGELAAIRGELAAIRVEQAAIRTDIARLDSRQQKFEERLTALEEKVDLRLSETRPIWEAVQFAIKRLEMKFDTVLSDLYDVRTNNKLLDKRLMKLEAG